MNKGGRGAEFRVERDGVWVSGLALGMRMERSVAGTARNGRGSDVCINMETVCTILSILSMEIYSFLNILLWVALAETHFSGAVARTPV